MSQYYRMLFQENESLGVGFTTNPIDLVLPYKGAVADWTVPVLDLRDGEFADYLSSSLACRLCSNRLKTILQRSASRHDELQWLDVLVRNEREQRVYYILHFPSPPDVLNKKKTIFAGEDFVVKPVLSIEAVSDHHVFAYPKNEGLPLFVANTVKRQIEEAGCTGIEFSRLPIA